jgi:hypothetical protein
MSKNVLVPASCLTVFMLFLSAAHGQQRRNPQKSEQQSIDQLAGTAHQLSAQGQLELVSKIVGNMQFFVANKGKAHKPTCQHANLNAGPRPIQPLKLSFRPVWNFAEPVPMNSNRSGVLTKPSGEGEGPRISTQ